MPIPANLRKSIFKQYAHLPGKDRERILQATWAKQEREKKKRRKRKK